MRSLGWMEEIKEERDYCDEDEVVYDGEVSPHSVM